MLYCQLRKLEYKPGIRINIWSYIFYTQAESQGKSLQFSEHENEYRSVSGLLNARTKAVGESRLQLLRGWLIWDQTGQVCVEPEAGQGMLD